MILFFRLKSNLACFHLLEGKTLYLTFMQAYLPCLHYSLTPMCGTHEKSCDHLFLGCLYIKLIDFEGKSFDIDINKHVFFKFP